MIYDKCIMRNINECKTLLQYRCTKAGYNASLSPDDFNLIFQSAEQRYYNKLYSRYGIDQSNTESLSPFKSNPTTLTIDGQGKVNKPSDLLHIDALRSYTQDEIQRVEDDRLGSHLKSSYDAPTIDFPIYTEYSTYLQFYPITLGSALCVYLKELIPSKWAYTLVNGRPVYDSANSVQPKWSDDDIDQIIFLAMSDLAISTRDQLDLQYSEQQQAKQQ